MNFRPGRKKLRAGLWVVFGLGASLAVPLLISWLQGEEVKLDNISVVAAPRDTFDVGEPIAIDALSRALITNGRLAIGTSNGEMLSAKKSARLLASGGAMLVLDRGELTLGQAMASPAKATGPDAPLVAALKSGSFKALAIRNGTIVVRLPGGYVERLSLARVQLVPDSSGSVEVKGEGLWRGQRSEFTLSSQAPDDDGRLAIAFTLKANLIDVTFEGLLALGERPALRGSSTIAIKDAERLANALGRSWPIGTSLQEVVVAGPLRWEADMLAFDKADVTIDGNKARGALSLKTKAERSIVSGTLAFEKFDIAGYMPRGPVARDPSVWQWWQKLAASLSGQSTPAIDADVRLSANELVSGKHAFGPAAATISMKDGRFAADVAEFDLLDGRASGQLSVDFNRFVPSIRMRAQVDGIATGRWLTALAGQPYIDGTARIKADLTSHGVDPVRMVSELQGRVDIAMDSGAVIGLAVDELRTKVASDGPEPASEILKVAAKGETRLKPLTAVAIVSDGVVDVHSSTIGYDGGRLRLAGRFDLVNKGHDLRLLAFGTTAPLPKAATATLTAANNEALPVNTEILQIGAPPTRFKARLLCVRTRQSGRNHEPRISLHPIVGDEARLQSRLDLNTDVSGPGGL